MTKAEKLAVDQYEHGLAENSPERQAYFAWLLARVMVERGRVRTAIRYARTAVALFRQLGRPAFTRDSLQVLTLASALAGDTSSAADALASIDELGLPAESHTPGAIQQARAWYLVAAGDFTSARTSFREAASQAERSGDLIATVTALHGIARIGYVDDVLHVLQETSSQIEEQMTRMRMDHVRALAHKDGRELEEASTAFQTIGADLLAADAAADAAAAWRLQGNRRRAAAAEHRALEIVDTCEGAVTPSIRAIVATRTSRLWSEKPHCWPLPAEATNRSLHSCASRCGLENRLQQVYYKLGLTNRKQLAETLQNDER